MFAIHYTTSKYEPVDGAEIDTSVFSDLIHKGVGVPVMSMEASGASTERILQEVLSTVFIMTVITADAIAESGTSPHIKMFIEGVEFDAESREEFLNLKRFEDLGNFFKPSLLLGYEDNMGFVDDILHHSKTFRFESGAVVEVYFGDQQLEPVPVFGGLEYLDHDGFNPPETIIAIELSDDTE